MTRTHPLICFPTWSRGRVKKKDLNLIQVTHNYQHLRVYIHKTKLDKQQNYVIITDWGVFLQILSTIGISGLRKLFCHIIGRARLLFQEMH